MKNKPPKNNLKSNEATKDIKPSQIQTQITKGLTDVFGLVHSEREKYYASGKPKPTKRTVNKVIQNYMNANTVITGGAGLVPGALGLAAAVPELILILRNQLSMCYDIGAAYGQEEKITKELLLAVLVATSGITDMGILKIEGDQIIIQRLTPRVVQKVLGVVGEKIAQRAIRSSLSKWIPGLGAAAMALWTRLETQTMAKKAEEIFSKDIAFTDKESDEDITLLLTDPIKADKEFLVDKLKLLINMMKVDGTMKIEEIDMIKSIATEDFMQTNELHDLLTGKQSKTGFQVNLRQYAKDPLKATEIVIELAAVAKSDSKNNGEMNLREKAYLKWVCLRLGVDEKKLKL